MKNLPTSEKTQDRVAWCDCAKGIGAFFVILMHVPKPTIYSRLCVPVFLCIFFITAGYLFRPDTNLRNSLRKMLQEFLIYGFITTVLYALLTGTPLSWNPLIGALLQVPTHTRYPESILWFLPCFMVSKLIFS